MLHLEPDIDDMPPQPAVVVIEEAAADTAQTAPLKSVPSLDDTAEYEPLGAQTTTEAKKQ